jgi:hypothetical protein
MVTVPLEKFFILTKFDSLGSALLNLMMSNGVKGMWKNCSVPNFWIVSEILTRGTEKIMKHVWTTGLPHAVCTWDH